MNEGDYALIIGISRYPELQPLEGPVRDAEEMARWVTTRGSVPTDNVSLVVSPEQDGAARPALHEIDAAFERLLAMAGSHARRLYVYFAGHGCACELRHVALLMANASLEYLNRAINASEYERGLANYSPFPEQVFFYDCCRNYERRVRGRAPEWADAPPHPPDRLTQMVVYGAGFTEYANERAMCYSTKRGLFTRALLEGLQGAAATRQDGSWVVTSRSLLGYLHRRVEQLATSENLRQRIGVNSAGSGEDLVLVQDVDPWEYEVTVTVPAQGTLTGTLTVRDYLMRPVSTSVLQPQVREVALRLVPGIYLVDHHPSGNKRIVTVQPEPLHVDLTREDGQ